MDIYSGGWPGYCYVDRPHIDKCQMPKISLSQARRSWYITPLQGIFPVNDPGNEEAFTAFVLEAIGTLKKPGPVLIDIVFMDFRELLDRWYTLDTLLVHHARCPLYPSLKSAVKALYGTMPPEKASVEVSLEPVLCAM